ncbi:MAG TPA: PhnD/SsuA/transferrin family substrate-binding protein [Acidimicrobiia bacterium]|nr:PhnD/SsuA/transferrin family substrate-binding protein [Acidimicrobiia bacterium]
MQLHVASCLSHLQNRLFSTLMDLVGSHLGVGIELAAPEDADIVYRCGLPTGRAVDLFEPWYAPVLAADRYRGLAVYFGDVVVRPRLDPRSWLDLAGARFAYNEAESFSGHAAIRHELRRRDLPATFFSWRQSGSHRASLDMVLSGEADLASIDSMVLELEGPPPDSFTVFARLGPYPMPPISTSRNLDSGMREEAGALLATLHDTESGRRLLDEFGVSHMSRVSDGPYRGMAELVRGLDLSVPPPTEA